MTSQATQPTQPTQPKSYYIWQKPYAKEGTLNDMLGNNVICCPFAHTKGYLQSVFANTAKPRAVSLREFHRNNGYNYKTSDKTIERYLRYFESLRNGDKLYIPKRSQSKTEDKNAAYEVQVNGNHYHGVISVNGQPFHGYFIPIRILNNNYPIPSGIRYSVQVKK